MNGNVLIHFSNGTTVYCHAHFLWNVRESDGNIAIADEAVSEDDDSLNSPIKPDPW